MSDTRMSAGRRRETRVPRALIFVLISAFLEMLLILPVVDRLADRNPTIHFTQHGLIFVGGVLMGIALRDAYRISRSS
jgi:hypothetical protein